MMQLPGLIDEFRAEATDHLAALDAELLKLERQPSDAECVRRLFLAAHSIKGGAAMLNLNGVRDLAHATEGILGRLRDNKEPLRPATADLMFQAVDGLRKLIDDEAGASGNSTGPATNLVERLRAHLQELEHDASPAAPLPTNGPEPLGRPMALLIENSPTLRALEGGLLSDAGYSVDVEQGGDEGLARALAREYRLVVSGMEIKGLRGLDLAAALRGGPQTKEVAIVLLTAEELDEDRRKATDLGVDYLRRDKEGNRRLQEIARSVLEENAHER